MRLILVVTLDNGHGRSRISRTSLDAISRNNTPSYASFQIPSPRFPHLVIAKICKVHPPDGSGI